VIMATGDALSAALRMAQPVVRLLEEDPDLAENMRAEERELAARVLVVRVATLKPGEWEPPAPDASSLGLLVLDGLLVRRLQLGPMPFAELLGPGDVLQPWEEGLAPDLLPALSRWKVLQPARLGLLDRRANAVIGRWPELNAALASRILRRSRQLSYSMASQHFFRVDERLMAVLWRIALMWGRVRTDGILIPFRLTHEMLAEIICARRPSVTQAIASLERQGRIRRTPEKRLVVLGDPPAGAGHEPTLDGDGKALAPRRNGAR
jgi:CRP/FNR family transcriptional regulator, cyclic AMP receptor protein